MLADSNKPLQLRVFDHHYQQSPNGLCFRDIDGSVAIAKRNRNGKEKHMR